MIAIDWYGPYLTLKEARAEADIAGFYMVIGRRQGQKRAGLQYIGIGGRVATRLNERHHAIRYVQPEGRKIWLGMVSTAEPGGRKLKATPKTLDYGEWMHALYCRLPLNKMKTKNEPPVSVTVINRWLTAYEDEETENYEWVSRPHADWPDLIDFPDAYEKEARMVWFDGTRRMKIDRGQAKKAARVMCLNYVENAEEL